MGGDQRLGCLEIPATTKYQVNYFNSDFEVAHICQALLEKKSLAAIKKGGQCSMNTVHTNWTAGLRVVAGVLRV